MRPDVPDPLNLRDEIDKKWQAEALDKILDKRLCLREATTIRERIYNQKTLADIGKIYGVHKERIRQIEAKALRKLRHPSSVALMAKAEIQVAIDSYEAFLKREVEERIKKEKEYQEGIGEQKERVKREKEEIRLARNQERIKREREEIRLAQNLRIHLEFQRISLINQLSNFNGLTDLKLVSFHDDYGESLSWRRGS